MSLSGFPFPPGSYVMVICDTCGTVIFDEDSGEDHYELCENMMLTQILVLADGVKIVREELLCERCGHFFLSWDHLGCDHLCGKSWWGEGQF